MLVLVVPLLCKHEYTVNFILVKTVQNYLHELRLHAVIKSGLPWLLCHNWF